MGGFATQAQPNLWAPGSMDPRIRSFTKIGEMKQVGPLVQVPTPPAEDLDRIALMFAMLDGGGTHSAHDFGEWDGYTHVPKWTDLGPDDQSTATLIWAQAVALGTLPEDTQSDTPTSLEWANWPEPNQPERRVYLWVWVPQNKKLYKHMQVQKRDSKGAWHVFNKWGQNLTFVWRPEINAWQAGWDLGDWFVQNARDIAMGIQMAVYAVISVMTLGAGSSVAAAAGAAFAAQKAMVAGMQAIVTGDLGKAALSFVSVATNIEAAGKAGGVDLGGKLADAVPDAVRDLANSNAMKSLASVLGDAASAAKQIGDLKLPDFFKSAAALAPNLTTPTEAELAQARDTVPEHLRVWFDFGLRDARNRNADTAGVPWYATSAYAIGAVLGEIEHQRNLWMVTETTAFSPATARLPKPVKAARITRGRTVTVRPAVVAARPASSGQKAATVGAVALAALAALRLLRFF